MRRVALVLGIVAVAACAKKDAGTTPPAPPMAPAGLNMASVAGMWTFKVMSTASDSALVTYTVTATADTAGWSVNLPERPAMTPHVTIAGDSIVLTNGPYESVLRKGQQVSTSTTLRLVGDKLVGTTIAHYSSTGADSVATLRAEGTKMKM